MRQQQRLIDKELKQTKKELKRNLGLVIEASIATAIRTAVVAASAWATLRMLEWISPSW